MDETQGQQVAIRLRRIFLHHLAIAQVGHHQGSHAGEFRLVRLRRQLGDGLPLPCLHQRIVGTVAQRAAVAERPFRQEHGGRARHARLGGSGQVAQSVLALALRQPRAQPLLGGFFRRRHLAPQLEFQPRQAALALEDDAVVEQLVGRIRIFRPAAGGQAFEPLRQGNDNGRFSRRDGSIDMQIRFQAAPRWCTGGSDSHRLRRAAVGCGPVRQRQRCRDGSGDGDTGEFDVHGEDARGWEMHVTTGARQRAARLRTLSRRLFSPGAPAWPARPRWCPRGRPAPRSRHP